MIVHNVNIEFMDFDLSIDYVIDGRNRSATLVDPAEYVEVVIENVERIMPDGSKNVACGDFFTVSEFNEIGLLILEELDL